MTGKELRAKVHNNLRGYLNDSLAAKFKKRLEILEDYADEITNLLSSGDNWISVEERLPPKDKDPEFAYKSESVLIHIKDDGLDYLAVGEYWFDKKYWIAEESRFDHSEAELWQPLPKAREEK